MVTIDRFMPNSHRPNRRDQTVATSLRRSSSDQNIDATRPLQRSGAGGMDREADAIDRLTDRLDLTDRQTDGHLTVT